MHFVRGFRPSLFLAAMLAATACDRHLGAASDWRRFETIEGQLAPESAPTSATSPPPTAVLRVVTYNVELGADVDGLARALGEDPDLASAGLLLLQEEESYPGEGGSRSARLAAALGLGHVYVPARIEGDGTHGLAILSAYPITNVRVMDLPYADTGENRIAVSADILIGDRVLHVINVHLDPHLNITDRILQLRPAVIDADDAVLVVGDFNTNPLIWLSDGVPLLHSASADGVDQAPILDDYMAELGFEATTAHLGATEHMYGVESRLDTVYARGITVTPGAVVRRISISDHWPVWVDVAIP